MVTEGSPLMGGASPEPAASSHDRETIIPTDPMEIDEQALMLRRQSKGFGSIAATLGLRRANDANEAFNRALRRRPPEEQAAIRMEENGRLDRLRNAVSTDASRSKEEIAKRLRAVDRLRARLMSD